MVHRARRIRVLGGFRIDPTGAAEEPSRPGRRLVAYLALHPGPHYRDTVAEALWPERRRERSHNNLRQTLHVERRGGQGLIRSTRDHVQLIDSVAVDLHEATAAI